MGVVAGARSIGLGALVCASLASGCVLANGPPITIEQATYAPTSTDRLRAGVAEVDVTPPPGLPSYGYSTNGVADMRGYWLRLKARIIVLEQPLVRRPPDEGEEFPVVDEGLVVLVQADFGASSALIHRGVAARLGSRGVSPANLVFATTHTHGGPGGIFQDKFFNKSVGARPLFVPEYVDHVVVQIADGIERALADVQPAKIGFAEATAAAATTFNRSYDAWERNALDLGDRPDPSRSVDRTLRLLRVDVDVDPSEAGEDFQPAGVFSVFAVHGTAMPASYALFHGDVHGLAARLGAHEIRAVYPRSTRFVAATATGAQGDVSPGQMGDAQGKDLTMTVAAEEAATMVRAFRSLDGKLSDRIRFSYAYHEASMRGASTSRGRLCDEGALGAAEAAGSEASQGPLNGFLEMTEGAHRGFDGCQSRKIKFLGAAQDLFYSADEYPDTVPFQVVRFAGPNESGTGPHGEPVELEPPSLVLASFPGEATTGVGELVASEIHKTYRRANVATVGLTNSYATYFTTPSEYMVQDYEGGTTFYGPFQGVFAAEQLGLVTATLPGPRPARTFLERRTFQAGEPAKGVWPTSDCHAADWKPGAVVYEDVQRSPSTDVASLVGFRWEGAKPGERCALPAISIECLPGTETPGKTPKPWSDDRGWPVTDEGFDFEVIDGGGGEWTAWWTRHGHTPAGSTCYFVVEDVSARTAAAPNERVRWIASTGGSLEGPPR